MSNAHRYVMQSVAALMLLHGASVRAQNAASASPPDSARLAAARAVIEASGTVESMVAGMKAALPAQKAANTQLPDEFWTRVEKRLAQDAPQLADSIAVVYATNFTQPELEALTAFYHSPAGMRLRELQPQIIAEASAIGQRWGMRIGAEIGASLKPE
jgi:hypothetical protein